MVGYAVGWLLYGADNGLFFPRDSRIVISNSTQEDLWNRMRVGIRFFCVKKLREITCFHLPDVFCYLHTRVYLFFVIAVLEQKSHFTGVMPKKKQWKLETMLTTMEDNVKAHDRERKRIARSKPETRARQNALQRERRALKRQQAINSHGDNIKRTKCVQTPSL
ncbi:hypothetical protein CDAR_108651 [Caerostris darwini]|uniref:Uncharacterized protein n=1 Tax=Caerostris darwini TaxID=1538125 RepID=A0AAV4UJ04_9ARAC|nr:hypothetical protein CDAR_108651 [Caerostris darwini]